MDKIYVNLKGILAYVLIIFESFNLVNIAYRAVSAALNTPNWESPKFSPVAT